jgi:predicted DNA-binding helix-hairpin-helix protein
MRLQLLSSATTGFNDYDAAAISFEGGVLKVGDMRATTRLALGVPIDLNSASTEEISLVPGIGQNLGARIFQFKLSRGKIKSLSELTAVPGIKEKKLNSLRRYVTVGTKSKMQSEAMEER